MQPSIPWSKSVSVFVIEKTSVIHSLKCTAPFSLIVPLLSLAVTHCYLLSLVVLLVVTLCHLFTTPCHSLYHSLPFIVIWLSLVCLFINDPFKRRYCTASCMFEVTDVYDINLIWIILPWHCFAFKTFLRSSKLWSIRLRNICDYCLTKLLLTMMSIWLNYINSFWLFRKCIKTYLENHYQFFDILKTKYCKIRRSCNLLIKVKFHGLEWSSPLNTQNGSLQVKSVIL